MTDDMVLVLRTCGADMTSYQGFRWPKRGKVEAPDWDPDPTIVCGHALHGLLWGEGDGSLLDWSQDAKWLVVRVRASDVAPSQGKVRFPRGVVVACGDHSRATSYLVGHGAPHSELIDRGSATAGDGGSATAGDRGTATAGYGGTATAGYRGSATAGDRGTATAGYRGTATAGYGGTATAGDGGTAIVTWWDGSRCRLAVGYVGENGIKANTAYRADHEGHLVKASGHRAEE